MPFERGGSKAMLLLVRVNSKHNISADLLVLKLKLQLRAQWAQAQFLAQL